MSLKAVHIFFILCSIFLSGFLGWWLREAGSGGWGLVFFAGALGLVGYLIWFVLKLRRTK